MGEPHDPWTARLAVTAGIVTAGCAVSLATFFIVGGPFGTINDYGNAAAGVLAAALAWRLRSRLPGSARSVALGLATLGAAITVVGSALVTSGTTGFFLAGLVSSLGFAGIGAWLALLNRADGARDWPARLRALGIAAGALMAVGVVTVPGITARYDDMSTAPGWVWIAFIGWLGIYVLYPAWAIRLGLGLARRVDVGPRNALTAREAS